MRKILRNLNARCRDAAQLLSDVHERPLLKSESVGLAIHLLLCRSCRDYRKQLDATRAFVATIPQGQTADSTVALSTAARERIRKSLEAD
jgi:hypothetical protein